MRPVRARAVAERDVEGLRAAGAAGRLARHATTARLLERLERRKHYTSICNAGPSEFLATLALRHGDAVRGRNRAIIERNLPIFDAFFARWSERFEWEHPQGGCVCFPRYLGGDAGRFCRELLEAEGVVLLPADIYASELGAVPRDRFRIGVGRRDPEPALAAFDAFLAGLKEEWTAALVRRDGPEVAKGRRVSGEGSWTARWPYVLGGGQPPCSPYIRRRRGPAPIQPGGELAHPAYSSATPDAATLAGVRRETC